MTTERAHEIRARCEKATPGPWKWFDYPDGRKLLTATARAVIHCPDAPMTCDPADATFISHAREDVPWLLEQLNALAKRASTLEDAAFHFQTCRTCAEDGEDSCESGRWFAAFLRGENDAD